MTTTSTHDTGHTNRKGARGLPSRGAPSPMAETSGSRPLGMIAPQTIEGLAATERSH